MKPALLSLSLLLLAFIAKPSLSKAEPVLDAKNNPLLPGSEYYVSPYIVGPLGGGVRLAEIGNSDCPVDIVQEPFDVFRGQALIFQPPIKIGIIPTGTPLSVSFAKTPKCAPESSEWILPLNSTSEPSFVRIGVAPPILKEAFQIKRYGTSLPWYKFVHKSTEGTFDIGIKFDEYGNRRLAAIVDNDDPTPPFIVVFFQKASYENANIKMKTA